MSSNSSHVQADTIPDDQVAAVLDLYEQGLYLQAYRKTQSWGPIGQWRDAALLVLGGRMAANLGSTRLGAWLMRRAYRSHPEHPEAHYYHAYTLFRMRSPHGAWRWMQEHPELPGEPSAEVLASWYALFGEVLGFLRDFETAESWLRRAGEVESESAWTPVCWASVLENEDRYDEALEAARQSLEVRPWYRPGVQSVAHILTLLGRDDEALEVLMEATERLESGAIAAQLYGLQIELKMHEQAGQTIDLIERLMPLADKRLRRWIAAQRSEVAYRSGDIQASIEFAEQTDDEFMKTVAQRLKDPAYAGAKVIELPVGFVRQHHATCAPATLAAISSYWKMPADHLQVADEICYNGTSCYNERRWADQHGWVTREFTVDEASAIALLERGIPFTLVTVDPGSSHLQAVIGFDGRRGTLIIRDPFWRNSNEGIAEKVLKRYAANGPRGMALVPRAEREKLESLDLPDAPLWDLLYELDGALVGHRRSDALRVIQRLEEDAPEHRLTLEAKRRLALYDSNPADHLAAVEQLADRYPDNQPLQLERLSLLRDLARREERLETYDALCQKKETHPIFWQQYAQELGIDARRHGDAITLLRRALRRWPMEAGNYYVLANIYWGQRRFDEALELYRFAACLDDKEEQFAQGYFSASVCRKETDRALRFLRDRFHRFGRKSALPARTLFNAYLQLECSSEALQVIEESLELRPDDGELLLFAADAYLACSTENMPKSAELVERARDRSPTGAWLRTVARMAAQDGRSDDSLKAWRQLLKLQPLAIDAHASVARLLAEVSGKEAALEHLREAAARFPHHQPLHMLWIEWLRDEPPEVREPVIRRVIEAMPDNAWARRELALLLSATRRMPEAWEQVKVAGELEPNNPSYHMVRAHLLRSEDRIGEAKASLMEAIKISVDEDFAIAELINLCYNAEERREVLAFVREQLQAQVIFGDGLLAFRNHASGTLEPEELLASLRETLEARPDLWHAWSAVTCQLLDMNRLDDAREISAQATERFPLVPRIWLDRAVVCQVSLDDRGELAALQTAHQINPAWGAAARALCDYYDRHGEFENSKQLLEQALARDPLDVANHTVLAESLWRLGERDAALARVQRAIQLDPGYERAWDLLSHWAGELGCPEVALEAARELTRTWSGEANSWLMLARLLDEPEQLQERLAALDEAIRLNPRSLDAHDMRAVSLASEGRWDEALAACRPAIWANGGTPSRLRARAAWIEAQRGDLQTAIAQMREVVSDEPQFFEAWLHLADWCQMLRDTKGYLEAAEMMVRLRPQYEVSLGYLGEARLLNDDRAGALEAYRRAFELAPAYGFTANSLFALVLEDGDLQHAGEILEKMRKHIGGPFVHAREVQLAAKQEELGRAAEALERVCTTPCPVSWPISAAVQAMVEAGWEHSARKILEDLLEDERAEEEVGRQWGRLCSRHDGQGCECRLPQLVEHGRIGGMATYGYIEGLVQEGMRERLMRFIRKNAGWLRSHTHTWGAAGFGLTALREYQLAYDWMKDWQNRTEAEPWMLVNVAEALRAFKHDEEAVWASQQALAMPPAYGQHLHHIWLAADAALALDVATAIDHLRRAQSETLDADYEFMTVLIESVLAVATAEGHDRAATFREVGRRIKTLRKTYEPYMLEPARRRLYRNAVSVIARLRGGFRARLWSWGRWMSA